MVVNDIINPDELINLIQDLRNTASEVSPLGKQPSRVFGEESEEILSFDDWAVLMKDSKCLKFKKNEVITKEGEWATKIYQIAKGNCRVEKLKDDGTTSVLGLMRTGELFGEISFLEGIKTTASIVAEEDETEVYVIDGASLQVLFVRQPALGGRFFQYLSMILSHRLKDREASFYSQQQQQ